MNSESKTAPSNENPLKRPLTIVFCIPEQLSHHFLKS